LIVGNRSSAIACTALRTTRSPSRNRYAGSDDRSNRPNPARAIFSPLSQPQCIYRPGATPTVLANNCVRISNDDGLNSVQHTRIRDVVDEDDLFGPGRLYDVPELGHDLVVGSSRSTGLAPGRHLVRPDEHILPVRPP